MRSARRHRPADDDETDVWTNMLRVTAASFAAGVGGADSVTSLPSLKRLDSQIRSHRRIARNTQLLLQEEAHAAKVADPGAGSFAIETLTDGVAHAAWTLFQEMRNAAGSSARWGGLLAKLPARPTRVLPRRGTRPRRSSASRYSRRQMKKRSRPSLGPKRLRRPYCRRCAFPNPLRPRHEIDSRGADHYRSRRRRDLR